jgi:hypothetical protein
MSDNKEQEIKHEADAEAVFEEENIDILHNPVRDCG